MTSERDPRHQSGSWDRAGSDLGRALVVAAVSKSSTGSSAGPTASPRTRRTGATRRPGRPPRSTRVGSQEWSSPGPDARDPQPLGGTLADVVAERGWKESIALHAVTARWPEIVGEDVAAQTTPTLSPTGSLVITCTSTAWAVQLRMLLPTIRSRIAEWNEHQSGDAAVVTEIEVRGPNAPSWRHGPRVVRGRGPRDTYG